MILGLANAGNVIGKAWLVSSNSTFRNQYAILLVWRVRAFGLRFWLSQKITATIRKNIQEGLVLHEQVFYLTKREGFKPLESSASKTERLEEFTTKVESSKSLKL
jgi:hypothetical protein